MNFLFYNTSEDCELKITIACPVVDEVILAKSIIIIITSNNHRLGSALVDLDPRLSLLCQVGDDVIHPCKICGRCQIYIPRFIHLLIDRLSHTIATPICIRSPFFQCQTQLMHRDHP